MKRILAILAAMIFVPAIACAQSFSVPISWQIGPLSQRPMSCNSGQAWIDLAAGTEYQCQAQTWIQVSGGASPGIFTPTQSPYNVVADAKSGADGNVSNGQNTLGSANQNCSPSDTGKLAIVVTPSTGAYPFGTGLVTVTGCSGTSWTLSATSNSTVAGTENWAVGTDNGTGLANAYAAAETANKILAVPCGTMIVAEPPFPASASLNQVVQSADIAGCAATSGSHFILHPHITSGLLVSGGAFFAQFISTPTTGTLSLQGLGLEDKIQNVFITSLQGALPGTAGQTFTMILNFNHLDNISVQGLGLSAGTLNLASTLSGEAHFHRLNFQNMANTGIFVNGVNFGGQGINLVDDSIFAFTPLTAVVCAATSDCVLSNDYIIQTQQGVIVSGGGSGTVITFIGNTCSVNGGAGSAGCLSDSGQPTTMYVFGNPLIASAVANFPAISLTNAGSILDISGSKVSSTTSGFNISGVAGSQMNDRVGNTFSSPLTQFSGTYIPIGGGSTATNKSTAATNFGTNLGAQTVVAAMIASSTLDIKVGARQVTLGVGCGAGSNTVGGTLSWTVNGLGQTATIATLTISANGAVGTSAAYQSIPVHADIGTAITFTTTSTLASTGCTTVPQYVLDFSTI